MDMAMIGMQGHTTLVVLYLPTMVRVGSRFRRVKLFELNVLPPLMARCGWDMYLVLFVPGTQVPLGRRFIQV
jgi:hypothetical protein